MKRVIAAVALLVFARVATAGFAAAEITSLRLALYDAYTGDSLGTNVSFLQGLHGAEGYHEYEHLWYTSKGGMPEIYYRFDSSFLAAGAPGPMGFSTSTTSFPPADDDPSPYFYGHGNDFVRGTGTVVLQPGLGLLISGILRASYSLSERCPISWCNAVSVEVSVNEAALNLIERSAGAVGDARVLPFELRYGNSTSHEMLVPIQYSAHTVIDQNYATAVPEPSSGLLSSLGVAIFSLLFYVPKRGQFRLGEA